MKTIIPAEMKAVLYPVILIAMFLSACATPRPADNLVYGLGDPDLHLIGRRLGFKVENLGMFDFRFSRGAKSFHVQAHLDISSENNVANDPLRLSYGTDKPVSRAQADKWNRDSGGWGRIATAVAGNEEGELRSNMLLDGGVTMRAVELHFRRFIKEIDSFESQLQSQH